MNQTNKKKFDCIAMKRDVQNQIYEETRNLNPQQQMDYFREAVKQSRFRKWWEKANSSLVKQLNKAS